MMRCFSALLLTGSLLSMPLAASADDAAQASRDAAATGVLRVTVVDQTGAAVAAAQVIVVTADGTARTAATNDRGEAALEALVPGTYTLRVEFPGFDSFEDTAFVVKRGQTKRDVILAVGGYAEELEVTVDNTDTQLAQAYSNTLTGEQIDALPDDEEEMAEVLEQMAGPGAILRVNGFSGGRLPPKSQIQEIRFRFDPYSAENHEAGFPRVDIMTRPGSTTWRNSASLTFRGDELNARNAFAPEQTDEQAGRYQWSIDGPLVKGKSSFALSVGGLDAYETETLLASTAGGTTRGVVSQPTTRLNVNLRLEHALSKAHVLRAEYQRNAVTQRNLGVGQFEQLDRAYDRETTGNVLRLSETGTFGGKLRNEFRFQFGWDDAESLSLSNATTIRVQDAFTTGGAQVLGGRRSRTLEIADNVDLPIGKRQTLRAGVLFEGGWYRGDELRNATGTFTFSSLDAYLAGQPIQFTRREGDPLVEYSQWQGAIYVQDDIRLRKNLMLSAGLRYEAQSHASDFDNLAPRAFVTWSPGKSGQTTIRAGAGVFHEWFDSSLYEQTLRLDGTRQRDIVIVNPGYPDPLSGGTVVVLPGSVIRVAEQLSLPTVQRASFGVEHRFTGWLQMRANVFTQRGSQELRSLNINAPIAGVRPDADYGTVSRLDAIGHSEKTGVDLGLNLTVPAKRIFAGLFYSYAQAKNDGDSATSLPVNGTDLAAEWAYARGDMRHRLFANISAPLAYGFRVNTNVRYQSGLPYSITTGFDDNGDSVLNDRPEGVGRNSARGDAQFTMDLRLSWQKGFGTRGGAATPEGPGMMGGGGRGPGGPGGPGGGRMNVGTNRAVLELFVDANNLMNAVNYNTYSGVVTSTLFGQPTSALAGRRIELGLRVGF